MVTSHFIQSARDNMADLCDLHRIESTAERLEFIDSILENNKYLFPIPERVEGGVRGTHPMQRELKAAKEGLASTLLPGGSDPMVYLDQMLS
jgi:hypothetical protein